MTVEPVDAARTLAARGSVREAELVLRGTLARDPAHGPARALLRELEQGSVPATGPALELPIVDAWIREGMLVEALALLAGLDFGGPAAEWATVLGELLAPVPAHAEEPFVLAHRHLLRGAASVALTTLEDRRRESALPIWAERRLALLRWMLLDNAQSAPEEPVEASSSELATVLQRGVSERSLEKMRAGALEFAETHPTDVDAPAVAEFLARLIEERDSGVGLDVMSAKTIPVFGRPAAAMQLRMLNLKGARSIYTKLLQQRPGESETHDLLDAVRGVMRVLEGLPVVDRSFPPPPMEPPPGAATESRADLDKAIGLPVFASKTAIGRLGSEGLKKDMVPPGPAVTDEVTRMADPMRVFEDETKSVDISEALREASRPQTPVPPKPVDVEALERAAAARVGSFEEVTKPVPSSELPLAAFNDEVTAVVDLPVDATMPDIVMPKSIQKLIEDGLPPSSRIPAGTPTLRMSSGPSPAEEPVEAADDAPMSESVELPLWDEDDRTKMDEPDEEAGTATVRLLTIRPIGIDHDD